MLEFPNTFFLSLPLSFCCPMLSRLKLLCLLTFMGDLVPPKGNLREVLSVIFLLLIKPTCLSGDMLDGESDLVYSLSSLGVLYLVGLLQAF